MRRYDNRLVVTENRNRRKRIANEEQSEESTKKINKIIHTPLQMTEVNSSQRPTKRKEDRMNKERERGKRRTIL